ncbi:hypothetical protein AD998_14835 [bacterium 336/3]|nr:hypothetical protein AD998_14835 [bacterium 336/3]
MKNLLLFLLIALPFLSKAQLNPSGEKITYKILKDGSDVAELTLQVDNQTVSLNNQTCYKITAIGKITAALGIINFDNKVTSWIDSKKLRPQKLHAFVDDGKKKTNFITEYNHKLGKAVSYTLERPSEKKTTNFSAETEDGFSAFYKLRQIDFKNLKINDIINIQIVAEPEKTETIKFKYLGKKSMSIYNGTKDCYILGVVAPVVEQVETSSIRIAVTADADQLPVKMYARTSKGFIVVETKAFSKR